MNTALLIAQFGYLAVLLGTVLEGETLLLLAGYSAHRGYLDLPTVIGVAWVGAMLGDQFFFWLGRRHALRLMRHFPTLRDKIELALQRIERHPTGIILTMRFLWGLRMALPAALGMSRIHWLKFSCLNSLSAMGWAALVAYIGWGFGAVIARHAAAWHHYEHWGMAGVILLALIWRVGRRWRARRTHATP